jgi:hypothetical protein
LDLDTDSSGPESPMWVVDLEAEHSEGPAAHCLDPFIGHVLDADEDRFPFAALRGLVDLLDGLLGRLWSLETTGRYWEGAPTSA